MNELEEKIRSLVEEACRYPRGNVQRQRRLTQIIRLTASKLWKDHSPYYADALQQTWVYFCQNICEATTGKSYDPTRASVVTWLNFYLKRRLQDFFIEGQKQQQTQAPLRARGSRSGEVSELIDPLENLVAQPDLPPILDQVKNWVEEDTSGELRQVHIEGHSSVTCQILILRRLPPEASWKDLSAEFSLSTSTLSSFYQRQCLPRLRKFGESEGYL